MNSPSEDIKNMLVADTALGLIFDPTKVNNLFIAVEPTAPKNCVTIFDTSGRPPQITLGGKKAEENYYYPSIQIRVRNTGYVAGWALIQNIRTSLHGRAQETWNGTLYSAIICSSGPAFLDWDENNRVRFVINFNIQRR